CHASIGRDDLQTPIKVRQVRLKAHGDDAPIGTDPWMACNTFTFSSPSGNYFGLFRPSLGTPSGVGIVGRTSKIADMQVPEVFQIMLGKKGQLADGIAEIIHALVTGQQTLPGSDSLQAVPAGQLLLAGAAPADSQAQSLTAGEVPTDKSARKDYCLNT
ncbi:(7S,10S)-hydroperoxide diol synthase, partial [Escherichia coli]|nr:(7S,10S)-hydroperoxide diol synthase [Escherichia coli]